ncbi:hypothetical protein PMAYCL1PPCAC_21708 [Pristionchus mayeri]|uniref:Uncharacterized protein n=1 Tax=Pristionchus mayeri TaxID=1317129 RepID=A0AAN5CV80_9BILA|nr:hypothetical protein PMAYCL1PPCAC_21708 [Pristionchus mayeri]
MFTRKLDKLHLKTCEMTSFSADHRSVPNFNEGRLVQKLTQLGKKVWFETTRMGEAVQNSLNDHVIIGTASNTERVMIIPNHQRYAGVSNYFPRARMDRAYRDRHHLHYVQRFRITPGVLTIKLISSVDELFN